ncbi:MAG: glycosyltransferase family 9 protein [Gemmatimonadaceae bacterium]
MTTPLLTELARQGPVTAITTPGGASLLRGHPAVHRLVVYDKRGADRGVAGFMRVARLVRAESPDAVAYLAQGSHRSGALARIAGYGERVGFATSAGRRWYTASVTTVPGTHHAERLWCLARQAREPNEADLRPTLFPGAEDVAAVEWLLASHAAEREPLIALAPGSVWATKRWPWFAELARLLASHGRIVVIGGPDDRALAGEVAAAVGERVIDATGKLPLLASAALIRRARVLVTNDSAPLHLASAMNTPTVAIFGPTVTGYGFGPLAERREVAEVAHLTCRPCHAHGPMTCPLGHFRCMRDLLPAQVLDAARRVGGMGA